MKTPAAAKNNASTAKPRASSIGIVPSGGAGIAVRVGETVWVGVAVLVGVVVLVGVAVFVGVVVGVELRVAVAVGVLDGVAVGVEVLVGVDVTVGVGPVVVKRTAPCGSEAGPQGPMTSRRNVLPVFAAPKLKKESIRFTLRMVKVVAFTTFDGFPSSTKRTVVTLGNPFAMKFPPEMIRSCVTAGSPVFGVTAVTKGRTQGVAVAVGA